LTLLVTANADSIHHRAEKRNVSRHPSGKWVFADARATPDLSRPVIDRFMTGGKRTNVSQFFFYKCRSNRRRRSG
jgi:hypothetical protein